MLIFDDCLSAVDTVTEERILNNLRTLMQGKTTFLISHRISTVKSASHIIVLEKGRISEEGTHESLIQKKGIYYEMYQSQNPDADNG
jgi:ATP-binding cassette subfamily B protein